MGLTESQPQPDPTGSWGRNYTWRPRSWVLSSAAVTGYRLPRRKTETSSHFGLSAGARGPVPKGRPPEAPGVSHWQHSTQKLAKGSQQTRVGKKRRDCGVCYTHQESCTTHHGVHCRGDGFLTPQTKPRYGGLSPIAVGAPPRSQLLRQPSRVPFNTPANIRAGSGGCPQTKKRWLFPFRKQYKGPSLHFSCQTTHGSQ